MSLVQWLIVLNASNLAPLVPLDGGRLLDILLFSRRPWLAAGFRLLAGVALMAGAWLAGSWILGLLAVGVLLSAPLRYQRARRERLFADNPQQLPDDLDLLDDSQKRELFGWARLLNHRDGNPTSLAGEMRTLHEHMVTRQPGVLVWLLFLALYLGGIAASLGGGLYVMKENATRAAQIVEQRVAEQAATLVADYDRKMAAVHDLRKQATSARGKEKATLLARAEKKRSEIAQEWVASPGNAHWRAITLLWSRLPAQRTEYHADVTVLHNALLAAQKDQAKEK
jgi:hypothetical protein